MISPHKSWYINLKTSSVVRLYYYKLNDYQICIEYTNNSQIKLPNQIYHGNWSPISAMTELAVLPLHGLSIHTAQYMFETLYKGAVSKFVFRKKFLNYFVYWRLMNKYLTKGLIIQVLNNHSIPIQILLIPLLSECHEARELLCS